MDISIRPRWVAPAIWSTLKPREKVYCILRTQNAPDKEIMSWLQMTCNRTYRYFKAKMKTKLFA